MRAIYKEREKERKRVKKIENDSERERERQRERGNEREKETERKRERERERGTPMYAAPQTLAFVLHICVPYMWTLCLMFAPLQIWLKLHYGRVMAHV